ncbi:MAG: hypothetical protein WD426_17950 [Anditalea sp.]
MNDKTPMVWYACYGSNLLKSRFLCYIGGGTPVGSERTYLGCTDTTLPKADKKITINRELYFAKKSKTWSGGGVGFIKPEFDESINTLGRMYLITRDQFIELVKQEIRLVGDLMIDFENIVKAGSLVIRDKVWYGRLISLGSEDGYPIFTFTNEIFLGNDINPPNDYYLKIMVEGLKESYGMSQMEIEEYLKTKIGIRNTPNEKAPIRNKLI